MKKATCKTSGFSHIFSGTQLFDGGTSNNEDHKVWRPLWFHAKACTWTPFSQQNAFRSRLKM